MDDVQTESYRIGRRATCDRCMRPHRVCVCTALPTRPLRLLGRILILQHPHELKKRLATVPLLQRCLDEESLTVVVGRKLQHPVSNPALEALLDGAQRGDYPLYVLFPGQGALGLAALTERPAHEAALRRAAGRKTACSASACPGTDLPTSSPSSSPSAATPTSSADVAKAGLAEDAAAAAAAERGPMSQVAAAAVAGDLPAPAYLLLVIDGTWRQAKEMYRAVAPRCLPPGGPGVQVALAPSDLLPPSGLRPPDRGGGQREAGRGVTVPLAADAAGDAGVGGTEVMGHDETTEGAAVGEESAALGYDPDMPCLIRKEPVAGFVTTYEATARAVGLLERDPALASELLAPLRLMTRLQAAFSPAILSRMRAEQEPGKD
ncbi:hypothetical protein PLESTB_000066700 [Pleodorina starrii]|uniref:tRNA-uridine aminocarboxypropyltransferase n=1 Tax=Pleodorina starrii TaxID=330485 RepID=A0A9W6B9W5_9CHLO|nr:hypothetical protein PLESTM_001606500 [Pleodorina starrii]GLC48169.1 hypothetical protein PLESTB_000066700 [Pleodorina starrii]